MNTLAKLAVFGGAAWLLLRGKKGEAAPPPTPPPPTPPPPLVPTPPPVKVAKVEWAGAVYTVTFQALDLTGTVWATVTFPSGIETGYGSFWAGYTPQEVLANAIANDDIMAIVVAIAAGANPSLLTPSPAPTPALAPTPVPSISLPSLYQIQTASSLADLGFLFATIDLAYRNGQIGSTTYAEYYFAYLAQAMMLTSVSAPAPTPTPITVSATYPPPPSGNVDATPGFPITTDAGYALVVLNGAVQWITIDEANLRLSRLESLTYVIG